MKHFVNYISFSLFYCLTSVGTASVPIHPHIAFIENKGQVVDQNGVAQKEVLFSGLIKGVVFHLRNNGISYMISKADSSNKDFLLKGRKKTESPIITELFRLDVSWLGIEKTSTIETDSPVNGYTNFYLENHPQGILGVKSYEGITYLGIYDRINLHYYQKNGNLKYDYLVQPNGDYKKIRMEVNGAEDIILQKDGGIVLKTPLGNILEEAPVVYQNGKKLKANWKIEGKILSFEIQNYDPNLLLLIDPGVRVWGTYYGEQGDEIGFSTKTDRLGNVFMAGQCGGGNGTGLATTGAHQTTSVGSYDGFLVKFNSNGVRQWATYYGAGSDDKIYACAADSAGNVYVAGSAQSNSGVATNNGHQSTFGGSRDAFLVKFDLNGFRLWGTYYGGPKGEIGTACAVDRVGNVYLAGTTNQSTQNQIATNGSHQPVIGGPEDAFLVKFNSNGVRLWGTYYGGSGLDLGQSCTTDAFNNIYLSGFTNTGSGNSIASSAAYQVGYGGGAYDAFLVKFDSAGVRQWGTYYGAIGDDKAYSCDADKNGNIFLFGETNSFNSSSIVTSGAHQVGFGGNQDAFLAKFNTNGQRQWGTYYGGTGHEYGRSVATDASGNVYFCGTTSTDTSIVIATPGSQQVNSAGLWDAFIAKFNTNGTRQFGTFYGGLSVNNYGYSCGTAPLLDQVYMTGSTQSMISGVIASPSGFQTTYGLGTSDAFLVKFEDANLTVISEISQVKEKLVIIPNPNQGQFNVHLNTLLENSIIEVHNALGQCVHSEKITQMDTSIDLSKVSAGIYFCIVRNGKTQIVTKFIKD